MDSLCDEILVKIFKNLDLETRIKAAKTCGRWRRLIFEPEPAFDDDISEVRFIADEGTPECAKTSARSILAHLDRRVRLNFSPQFVENGILVHPEMRACFGRFEKFVLLGEHDGDHYYEESASNSSYWSQLPASTKHVSIDESGRAQFDLNVFSDESIQLESLDLKLYQLDCMSSWDDDALPTSIVLPSGLKSFKLAGSPCPVRYLLQYVQLAPSLIELDLNRMEFALIHLLRLLRLIRDALPNLERLRFNECEVVYDVESYAADIVKFRNEQFLVPIKRIELDFLRGPYLHFKFAIKTLLEFCTVESMSIATYQWVEEIYDLTPMIVDKEATLELSIEGPDGIDDISVPTELARIVTKFALTNVRCPKVFRPMFVDASFDLLTEMRFDQCRDLGDAELAIVAERCTNLENLYFEPHTWNILDVLTDQCLLPFLGFWDDRRSTKLTIECLKPAAPFGGFNLPANGDTGGFTEGKRWARYRKTFWADGDCRLFERTETITLPQENGTRLAIWDSAGKSMVITDYKRNVERNFEVDLTDGGCYIEETRGPFY